MNRTMQRKSDGLVSEGRAGETLDNPNPILDTTNANFVFTAAMLGASKLRIFTGFTAARTATLDTAANILAANPTMDVGDSITVMVKATAAGNNLTIALGTGITMRSGSVVAAAAIASMLVLTKTSDTTMDAFVV